jgi:hypothetical protein
LYDGAKVALRGVSLDGVTSVAEALDRIRRRVAGARADQTVFTTALRLPAEADASRRGLVHTERALTDLQATDFRCSPRVVEDVRCLAKSLA